MLSDDAGATWAPVGERLPQTFSRIAALSRVAGVRGRAERDARAHERRRRTWAEVGVSTSGGRDRRVVRRRRRRLRARRRGHACCAPTTAGPSWQILNTGTARRPQAVLALDPRTVLLIGGRGRAALDRRRRDLHARARPASWPRRASSTSIAPAGRVFAYGSKNIVASIRPREDLAQGPEPRKALLAVARLRQRARPASCSARTASCSRRATGGERWLDLSGVGSDDATGMSFSSESRGYLTLSRLRRRLVRLRAAHHRRRPDLAPAARVERDADRAEGLAATGADAAFLLADSSVLLFTTSGGDRGEPSKVTIRTARRTVRRRSVIRDHGPGARRARAERGCWCRGASAARVAGPTRTATVASNGTFTTTVASGQDRHVRGPVGRRRGQRRRRVSCAGRARRSAASAALGVCRAGSRAAAARASRRAGGRARRRRPGLRCAALAGRAAPARCLATSWRRRLATRCSNASRGRVTGSGRGGGGRSACARRRAVRTTCLLMPSSLGSNPSASPTSCGRCSTGRPRSRPTTLAASGCWRSRFRWHSGHGVTSASAPGVDRVADVAARLLQRGLAVHRDHGEAAALARALVLDRLAAERLDQLLEVEVALRVLVVAEPAGRPQHVAAVERARRAGRSAAA